MLGNDDQAKDIVQDTMVTIWQKLNKIKSAEVYKTWLYRIVVNKCYDQMKGTIIRRIDMLSRQIVIKNNSSDLVSQEEIEKLLTIYKKRGMKFPSKSIDFSGRQINELIESLDELRIKYKDLENLIENDPELKKMIEQKLIENNRTLINL